MSESVHDERKRWWTPLPLGWAPVVTAASALFVLLAGGSLLGATAWSLLWWWSTFKVLLGVVGFGIGAYSCAIALRND